MKFLLDANIPHSAKDIFRRPHRAIHVRDIGYAHENDETIIAWAKRNGAVLITRDFDFANILRFPPQKYAGIVVLKIPPTYGAESIKRVLSDFLAGNDLKTVRGAIVIVEEGRVRIRR